MRKLFVLIIFYSAIPICHGQTEKTTTLNILHPGIGLELPIGGKNSIEFNTGIGINYSYRSFDAASKNMLQFLFTPFADLQVKHFYNFDKRREAEKSTNYNSGNFFALKAFYDGKKIGGNVDPEVKQLIAFGPTWGLQRSNGKFSLRGSVGPIVYGDFQGNVDFYLLNFNISFGYLLSKGS
ncbi:hypothetical protein [Algoriphagus terrigena]|uniref:hypothetical protein n=1 Tax=Algoriphagus terrigena TaxID=344884 RepID=UPI0006886ACB|nr:hypothetical protein [Algoriphagus terrigena]